MSIYLVGKTWYVDITPKNGPRLRESTGTGDKQAAQEYHDKLKAQLWRQSRLGEGPVSTATWDDAAKLWLGTKQRSKQEGYLVRWLTSQLKGVPLASMTSGLLEDVIASRVVSAGNQSRYAMLMQAILNRAKLKGLVASVPKIERQTPPEGRVRWLSAQEWERLQKHLPPYLLQAARFTLATGLREKNVLRLEWSQVDLKRKVAWIHPDQAKAKKAIGVPLNSDALRVLREQVGLSSLFVFPMAGRTTSTLSRASSQSWYKALKAADLVGFRWHDLRHTWASWHVQSGTRLEELQKLGGWKSLSMVTRYAHFAPDHLAKVAGNVRPIRRRAGG